MWYCSCYPCHCSFLPILVFSFQNSTTDRKLVSSEIPPFPTPRQAAFLFLRSPEKVRDEEQETLVTLCQIHLEVNLAYDLVQQFAQMLRSRTGESLDAWLAQVENSNLPELQSFASGIEKDTDAVRAGLTWWINNGMVEGHGTPLKLIKRQGYGRADFPLLAPGVCCMRSRDEGTASTTLSG